MLDFMSVFYEQVQKEITNCKIKDIQSQKTFRTFGLNLLFILLLIMLLAMQSKGRF